jgi:hypothetical protein
MNKAKFFVFLLTVGLLYWSGCKKDEVKTTVTITTAVITDISTTTATGGGTVEVVGTESVTGRGVCWGISHDPTTAGNKTSDGTGIGNFTSSLTGLISNTTYYVKAYAINSGETFYGNEVSFTTSAPTELIVNGDFSIPATGDNPLISAEPWKTEETTDTNPADGVLDWIGHASSDYKGHTGYVWFYDWSKGLYQTVGTVPSVATEYVISFTHTCTWNAWGDYKPTTCVIFSAYTGTDPTTRVTIDTVKFVEPDVFPGWDLNTWLTKSGSFSLTAEQATAFAGKNLVIEFDVLPYDGGTFWSDVWYDIDDISVVQQ